MITYMANKHDFYLNTLTHTSSIHQALNALYPYAFRYKFIMNKT